MRQIQLSTATAVYRRLYFTAVDKTNLQSRLVTATVGTFTTRISKNGAATAALTNPPVEIDGTNMPGCWYVELTATEVNTLGHVLVRVTSTNMEPREFEAEIVAWNPYDAVRAGLTALPNANAEAAGGLFTRGTGAGQVNQAANGMLDANLVRWINSVPNGLSSANVQVSVAAMQTDVVNATALASTAAVEMAAAVWDRLNSANVVANSVGAKIAAATFGDATAATKTSQTTLLNTIAGYIDTEVAAIKAKTDNLPADPASATSQTTIISNLATIAGYIDTEVAAIKAKTDNLPADPATQTLLTTVAGYLDTEIGAIKAKTDNLPAIPASQGDVTGAQAAVLAKLPAALVGGRIAAAVGAIEAGQEVTVATTLAASTHHVLDNTDYDTEGMLISGRRRFFPSAVAAAAATDGGSGQGEIASVAIDTEAVTPGVADLYRERRTV